MYLFSVSEPLRDLEIDCASFSSSNHINQSSPNNNHMLCVGSVSLSLEKKQAQKIFFAEVIISI